MRAFVRLSKPLVCAHCDAVIGTAAYRPLVSWRLDITSTDGDRLTPVAAPLLLRVAEQQLANAAPEERDEAQWRVRFITRQLLEVIYDLPCRQGHRTLMTSPQVARARPRAFCSACAGRACFSRLATSPPRPARGSHVSI